MKSDELKRFMALRGLRKVDEYHEDRIAAKRITQNNLATECSENEKMSWKHNVLEKKNRELGERFRRKMKNCQK